MFQQETAETAFLDMEGLEALYFLLKGEQRDYPVFFVPYLEERGPGGTLRSLPGSGRRRKG